MTAVEPDVCPQIFEHPAEESIVTVNCFGQTLIVISPEQSLELTVYLSQAFGVTDRRKEEAGMGVESIQPQEAKPLSDSKHFRILETQVIGRIFLSQTISILNIPK